MRSIVVVLLVCVLFLPLAFAVGVKGMDLRMKLDFVPNLTKEIEYIAISNAGFTQNHSIRIVGDLAGFVRAVPSVLELPDGGQAPFKVFLDLPERIEVPGVHPVEVFVEETQTRSGGGGVGAKVSAVAQIFLRVLFPTKTLVSRLALGDGDRAGLLTHRVFVENWGLTDFERVGARLSVFGEGSEPLETLVSPVVPLRSAEQKELLLELDGAKYEAGEYVARAWVSADGVPVQVHNGSFRVGTFNVVMLEATATFRNNSINKFNIKVRNEWNREVPNVYAVVRIGPSQVQSPTVILKPWEERVLTGYWDTSGFDVGSHEAYVTLYFNGKKSVAKVVVRIIPDLVVQTEQPIVQGNVFVGTLVGLVVLLVVLNAVLVFRLRRKRS